MARLYDDPMVQKKESISDNSYSQISSSIKELFQINKDIASEESIRYLVDNGWC